MGGVRFMASTGVSVLFVSVLFVSVLFVSVLFVSVFFVNGTIAAQTDEFADKLADELADDIAEVRRVFEADIRLFNGQDPTAFTAAAHKNVVLFGTLSPFAVEGKAAIQHLIQEYFTNYDYAKWAPVNAKFSVIGTSGLAWGHYTLRAQPKAGPRSILHGRYTFTYAREEGKWLLVALDFSALL